jgi:hypothetical protein
MLVWALIFGGPKIGAPAVIAVCIGTVFLLLLFNYVMWRTLGMLLTTAEERRVLTVEQRAELAWNFWWRQARRPKA